MKKTFNHFIKEISHLDPDFTCLENPLNSHSMRINSEPLAEYDATIDDRNEIIRDALQCVKEHYEQFTVALSEDLKKQADTVKDHPNWHFWFPDFISVFKKLSLGFPDEKVPVSDFLIQVLTVYAAVNKLKSVTVYFKYDDIEDAPDNDEKENDDE